MSKPEKFALGDRVAFDHADILARRMLPPDRRTWAKSTYRPRDPYMREGIVIGARVLSNGSVLWGNYDEPTTFTSTERFTAYLVAFNLRRSPVYVLPADLNLTDGAA